MCRIFIVLTLSIVSLLSHADNRIIAVEGIGEVEAKPDIIRINYNVFSQDKSDVSKAKATVDEISSLSVRALIKLGVSDEDITSSSLNVETDEDYDENSRKPVVRHIVRRDVDVIVRDISLYNAVIQTLVDNQVSEIGRVSPDVSNYESLKREALARAAQSAKSNAEFLAGQFDAKLDAVYKIGKQGIHRQYELEEVIVTGSKRNSRSVKNTPYEFKPGNVKVSSKIYVEYLLK